ATNRRRRTRSLDASIAETRAQPSSARSPHRRTACCSARREHVSGVLANRGEKARDDVALFVAGRAGDLAVADATKHRGEHREPARTSRVGAADALVVAIVRGNHVTAEVLEATRDLAGRRILHRDERRIRLRLVDACRAYG